MPGYNDVPARVVRIRSRQPASAEALAEIPCIRLGLKAQQIIAGHGMQEFFAPRKRQEDIRGGPGDMHEKPDPVPDSKQPQFSGQGDQVIIMDPDQIIGADQRRETFSEKAIDAEITLGVAPAEIGQVNSVMAQGPEHAVREAVIIFREVPLREITQGIGDRAFLIQRKLTWILFS